MQDVLLVLAVLILWRKTIAGKKGKAQHSMTRIGQEGKFPLQLVISWVPVQYLAIIYTKADVEEVWAGWLAVWSDCSPSQDGWGSSKQSSSSATTAEGWCQGRLLLGITGSKIDGDRTGQKNRPEMVLETRIVIFPTVLLDWTSSERFPPGFSEQVFHCWCTPRPC